MYKPLPKELRLGFSKIHDIGVFTKEKIKVCHDFGISHLKVEGELFRTPLGGFINHSETPNCKRNQIRIKPYYDKWNLLVIEDIEEGDELTLKYTWYDPQKK